MITNSPMSWANRIDWTREEALAEEWERGGLEQRARLAKCDNLYQLAYRHGSSYEHSDAWSLLLIDRDDQRTAEVLTNLTLAAVLYAAHKIAGAYVAFFELIGQDLIDAIAAQYAAAFPEAWASQAQAPATGGE